ncbi:MAG: FliC/FljB family flagellin [Pseudohongiellaceae bacterium]
MSVINTNITALIGQQNLGRSQNDLQTSMERLSSGLRINSAKDDAAGQAIANRMTSQISGLSQAQRNANDGISVAQTAEGALNQVNDNLQRIRELTVQAQNGTNSAEDLQSIQDEVSQRLGEIDRISEETSFNGVKVLSENQQLTIQVGANDGESISVGLQKMSAETLKLDSLDLTNRTELSENFSATAVSDTDGITAKFSTDDLTAPIDSNGGATTTTLDDIYEKSDGSGYAVLANNGNYYDLVTTDASALSYDSTTAIDSSTVNTEDGPVDSILANVVLDTDTNLDASDLTELNDADGNGTGEYVIDNKDGTYNMVTIATDGTADRGEDLTIDPLNSLDTALGSVDSMRSELGAMQNRFESAITNLNTTTTNLSAARSRIEDADYAVEVSEMTRAQILQQAGTSVLAQANQVPQSVLSLLG